MTLSPADREWVKAIVEAAVERAALAMQEKCVERLDTHTRTCPNMRYVKMLIIGAIVGIVLVAANGVITLANTIAPLFISM